MADREEVVYPKGEWLHSSPCSHPAKFGAVSDWSGETVFLCGIHARQARNHGLTIIDVTFTKAVNRD